MILAKLATPDLPKVTDVQLCFTCFKCKKKACDSSGILLELLGVFSVPRNEFCFCRKVFWQKLLSF